MNSVSFRYPQEAIFQAAEIHSSHDYRHVLHFCILQGRPRHCQISWIATRQWRGQVNSPTAGRHEPPSPWAERPHPKRLKLTPKHVSPMVPPYGQAQSFFHGLIQSVFRSRLPADSPERMKFNRCPSRNRQIGSRSRRAII